MRRTRLCLLLATTLFLPATLRGQEACSVAHIVDGDTFNCKDGRQIRLLLLNTPDAGRFGGVARRALLTLIPTGTVVRLETDSIPRDNDGRTLAYVFLDDGRMINEILVREGFAFFASSRAHRRYVDRMRAAETLARDKSRGVWAQ